MSQIVGNDGAILMNKDNTTIEFLGNKGFTCYRIYVKNKDSSTDYDGTTNEKITVFDGAKIKVSSKYFGDSQYEQEEYMGSDMYIEENGLYNFAIKHDLNGIGKIPLDIKLELENATDNTLILLRIFRN